MIKYNEGISFTSRNIATIERKISRIFNEYLSNNYELTLSDRDKEFLMGKTKDQLTVYIKELSATNDPWSMSNESIFIEVHSKKPIKDNDIMNSHPLEKRRYYKDKNKWYISEGDRKDKSRETFKKDVYKDIYKASEVAAFYAINSFFNVKEVYPNG